MSELRVAVLGPLRLEHDGSPVRLGPRQTELLSVLLVELGRSVPAVRLVDLLWGDAAPEGAPTTLRSHVSNLRRALGDRRGCRARALVTSGVGAGLGYRLDLGPDCVDAHRFERDIAKGRNLLLGGGTDEAGRAAALIGDALALWRGQAFADVSERPFALPEIARLGELHRSARRWHAEALSTLGRYAEVVGDLTGAVADDPYDEELRRLLALALYAERRVDDAAEVCREGAVLLRERGMDAPDLQELQGAILRRAAPLPALAGAAPLPALAGAIAPALTHAAPTVPDAGGGALVPRLLPPDLPSFVGRSAQIARAARICAGTDRPGTLIVTGPAGVGKSTFAVRLAHAVATHFPDGQLYVNLRGFDPARPAMTVDEAVRIFLDVLQVPVADVPASLDARVGWYRSLLAERRVLVVLDNARDAEQVHALLPGAGACAAVVTSRHCLSGLVVAEGAQPVVLDMLTAAESRELLVHRLGADRVDAEPASAERIVRSCRGLPLALAIVAARAAAHPEFRLAALATDVADVADGDGGLDGFAGGDLATDLRTVFSWSYRSLSDPAARLFRLLSLHPGPDIARAAAASLAGVPLREVRPLLAELARAQLLVERRPGRYTCHDLLCAYAAELAQDDTEGVRRAARHRMFDHYLHSAFSADRQLSSGQEPIMLPAARPGVAPEHPRDREAALRWFEDERELLSRLVWETANAASTSTPGGWTGRSPTY